jgi:hypothetical protein
MTCIKLDGGCRLEAKLCSKLQIVTHPLPPERIRPCDLQKLLNSLKLRKACAIDGIPNECLRHLRSGNLEYRTFHRVPVLSPNIDPIIQLKT